MNSKNEEKVEMDFINKFILTCNPYFLASLILLLSGIAYIGVDNAIQFTEHKMLYSFFSIQTYELLAVFTSVYLFRKGVLYDSVFLIFIGALLLFLPFIQLQQAVLENSYVASILITGFTLAFCKWYCIKRYFKELNFPPGLIICGALLLLINCLLPFVLKMALEKEALMQILPEFVLWYIPMVVFLYYFLSKSFKGGELVHKKRYVPFAVFSLWLLMTALNFVAIEYLYEPEMAYAFYLIPVYTYLYLAERYASKCEGTRAMLSGVFCALCIAIPYFGLREVSPVHFYIFLILNFSLIYRRYRESKDEEYIKLLLLLPASAVIDVVQNSYSLELGPISYLLAVIMCITVFTALIRRNPYNTVLAGFAQLIMLIILYKTVVPVHFFKSLACFLFLSLLWEEDDIKEFKGAIYFVASLWVMSAGAVNNTGYHSSLIVLPPLFLGMIWLRIKVYNLYTPKYLWVFALCSSGIGLITDGVKAALKLPKSILLVFSSFLVFGAGVLSAVYQRQKTDTE